MRFALQFVALANQQTPSRTHRALHRVVVAMSHARSAALSDQIERWSTYCTKDARNNERNTAFRVEITSSDMQQLAGLLMMHNMDLKSSVRASILILHNAPGTSVAKQASLQMLEMMFDAYRALMLDKAAPEFDLAEQRGRRRMRLSFFDDIEFGQVLHHKWYIQHALDVNSTLHRNWHTLEQCMTRSAASYKASSDIHSSEHSEQAVVPSDLPSCARVQHLMRELVERMRKCERQSVLIEQSKKLQRREHDAIELLQHSSDRLDLVGANLSLIHDLLKQPKLLTTQETFQFTMQYYCTQLEAMFKRSALDACRAHIQMELDSNEAELRAHDESTLALESAVLEYLDQAHADKVLKSLLKEIDALMLDLDAVKTLLREPISGQHALHPSLIKHGATLRPPRESLDIAQQSVLIAEAHRDVLALVRELTQHLHDRKTKLSESLAKHDGVQADVLQRFTTELRKSENNCMMGDVFVNRLHVLEQLKTTTSSSGFMGAFTNRWRDALLQSLKSHADQIHEMPRAGTQRFLDKMQSLSDVFVQDIGPSRRRAMQTPHDWRVLVLNIQSLLQCRELVHAQNASLVCELATELSPSDDFVLPRDWIARLPSHEHFIDLAKRRHRLPTFSLLYEFLRDTLGDTSSSPV
jgi:hypothetical protein